MAIDTKELRRLAQAALIGPDGVSLNWLKLLQDFQKEANPSVICELIDRLEAAEKDIALKEMVIDSLGSTLNAVANERGRDCGRGCGFDCEGRGEMTTKHTPGQWTFQPCEEYENSFYVMCEEGYCIATTHDGVRGDKNADANARLIAAAPDLLNELLSILDWAVTERAPLRNQEIKSIRKVIAKATGEQQ